MAIKITGRPPKPTALKRLAGNPGKRKLNDAEPDFGSQDLSCPKWLREEAKQEWKRVVKMLVDAGVAQNTDRAVLAAYCQAWARWVEAESLVSQTAQVLKSNSNNVYMNPALSAASMAQRQMLEAAAQLGMTPIARARIKAGPQAKEMTLADLLFSKESE